MNAPVLPLQTPPSAYEIADHVAPVVEVIGPPEEVEYVSSVSFTRRFAGLIRTFVYEVTRSPFELDHKPSAPSSE